MNNEPVAWIEPITGSVMKDYDYQNNPFANETSDWIPLYTHPVKEKGLPLSSPSPMNQAYLTRSDNNTPIAWSCWSEGMQAAIVTTTEPDMYGWQSIIPLFSHPVKELTDEEITEIFDTTFEVHDYENSFIKFARAILRKAQEK